MKILNNKRQLASGISVIAIAASLTLASPAIAQTTSSIEGRAAPGSTVTATDLNTGQASTARVDANGHYIIVGVAPSTYRIQSGTAAQTVVVPIGQTVTVDLAAAASPAAGAIVVVGSRTKDVRTPAVTTNVSRFQIENLPNGDRNFLAFAALAPGVTVSPPTLNGRARQVQAGAIASDFTNTFIDGLSIKNLVNHGGTLGQNYSSGNPFPQSAVDQFNVETQNFKAEYGQAGSAVITSVTKTGGEQFHGEIFGEWQPKSFISENYYDRPGKRNNANPPYRPKPDYHTRYFGGDLGGPIIKDKLTFFVDFEGTNKAFASSDINVYPILNTVVLPPDAQAYAQSAQNKYNGSYRETFKEKLYFGKLTYFATPDDTVNVSAFVRHESNLQVGGGITTTDASSRDKNNEDRYEAWWNHRGSDWLNELYIARDAASNGAFPNVPGPQYIVTYSGAPPTPPSVQNYQMKLGGVDFVQNDHQYQTLLKDNVTLTRGPHTIKFGGEINFTKLQRLEANNINGIYFYDANTFTGVSSSTPYAAQINTADVQPVTAKNTQIGLFAQDDWRPDDHWLVSYGLRWDYESNARNEKFVTPPDVAAALRTYWAGRGINPDDYISTGNNRKHFFGAFQPRLGVSYDVHGDRDIVLFGGLGRYYDRSLFIDAAIETIKDYYESISPLIFASDVGPLPMNSDELRALAAKGGGGEVHLLNNNTRVPFSDEVDAGIRKRFGKVNTSITFSYIKSHNIFQELFGNRLPDGSYNDGVPETFTYQGNTYSAGAFIYPVSAVFAAPLPGHGSIFIGNSDGKATYAAIYLQADKPYSTDDHYGFTGALTISNARTNNQKNTAYIGDPFNFDNVNIGEQGWGPVGGMERWRFVGTGTVGLPFDVRLSTVVTLSSGPSYGGFVCNVPTGVANPSHICYLSDFGIYRPHGIAYKNVDFNVQKSFKMPWNPGQEFTVYFEALNAFDFVNRVWSMGTGGWQAIGGPGPSHKPDPGSVASQGRAFKLGARFTF